MATAVIGVGHIGGSVARHLVEGGEPVVVSARLEEEAEALARKLGPPARARSVEEAMEATDVVVLALWLDAMSEVLQKDSGLLAGKVVVDTSNPIGFDDDGTPYRTLPEGTSAASVVVSMLPTETHYAKAFGTLTAESLANDADRRPRKAVLFYATDDDVAATTVALLVKISGFDPVRAGGVADAWRIEVPGGDLHQSGGLQGRLLDVEEAQAAVAAPHVVT
jgi:predicted dinucleotide-binding enzyme